MMDKLYQFTLKCVDLVELEVSEEETHQVNLTQDEAQDLFDRLKRVTDEYNDKHNDSQLVFSLTKCEPPKNEDWLFEKICGLQIEHAISGGPEDHFDRSAEGVRGLISSMGLFPYQLGDKTVIKRKNGFDVRPSCLLDLGIKAVSQGLPEPVVYCHGGGHLVYRNGEWMVLNP